MVKYLEQSYRVSERHACCVLEVARATHRYDGHQEQWIELRMRIREIAQTRVRYGYRMIRVLLNREGWKVAMATYSDKDVVDYWLRLHNRLTGGTYQVESWPDDDSTKKTWTRSAGMRRAERWPSNTPSSSRMQDTSRIPIAF